MSVSLLEVIEAAGYDISNPEDANWLLGKQSEFEELIEQSQDLVDNACELCGSTEDGHYNNNAECA